jgi:hypothetical protein
MRNGINVALISPRRYGKTSLLLRASERVAAGRPAGAVVEVNVLLCKDIATLAARLVAATYGVKGGAWHRARRGVPEFVHRFRIVPSVAYGPAGEPTFSFAPGLAPADADRLIGDVYALLEEEAKRRPAVLILDEFQAITRLGTHLPALLKGLADEHPSVSLVLAGSKRHLMEEMLFDQEAPLFKMAERIDLPALPADEMAAFLAKRAGSVGKLMDPEVAGEIVRLVGPVPNDIQRLAYEAFEVAARRIDRSAVELALERIVTHESQGFMDTVARCTPGQYRVLVALASGHRGSVMTSGFARTVGLAGSSSVVRVIDALTTEEAVVERSVEEESDEGVQIKRGFAVADPFFAEWLCRTEGIGRT